MDIDANVALQLSTSMDGLSKNLTGVQRAMMRPPAQPFPIRLNKSAVVNAAGSDLVLRMGNPASGCFWYVMGATVGGLTYATVAAGTALLVVSNSTPINAAQLGTGFVYDQAASLPLPAGYSRAQIPVMENETLFIIIVGGTIGQSYVAAATVEQYETGERVQSVTA